MLLARFKDEEMSLKVLEVASNYNVKLMTFVCSGDFTYLVSYNQSLFLQSDQMAISFAGEIFPDNGQSVNAGPALQDIADKIEREELDNCLSKVYGDFCGALIDRTGRCILVGSKMGLPCLYYYNHRNVIISSENLDLLLCVIHGLGRPLSLDRAYIASYLLNLPDDYFSTEPVPTIYKEIKTIPRATYLTLLNQEETTPHRYWAFWNKGSVARSSVVEEVRDTLLHAVQVRGKSDNTAVLLSGGLDSSSVACALANVGSRKITCFSNVFTTVSTMNERIYADSVVESIQGEPCYINSDEDWALKSIPDKSRRPQAEPYQGWFYAQELAVANVASSRKITHILDGVGGDELFSPILDGGKYRTELYPGDKRAQLRIRAQLTRGIVLKDLMKPSPPDISAMIPTYITREFQKEVGIHEILCRPFKNLESLRLDYLTSQRLISLFLLNNSRLDSIWVNREAYNPYGIYRLHPFLDPKLVELIFTIPVHQLMIPSMGKYLLRQAMGDLLPEPIKNRKLKSNFGLIFNKGTRVGEKDRIVKLMKEPLISELGFVDLKDFHTQFQDYVSGTRLSRNSFYANYMWQALTLEIWLRDQLERGRTLVI